MEHKIIKTDDYLLIVSDYEIKEKSKDWFYSFETGKVYDTKTYLSTVSCKKIICHLPLNSSPILEGIDLLPDFIKYEWHCPNCKKLVDGKNVTFLENHDLCGNPVTCIPVNEDIDKLSERELKLIDSVVFLTATREEENIFHQGFYTGYNKAKEKYRFTEKDLGLFLEYVRNNYTGMGAPHLVHNKGGQRKTEAIVEDYIQWQSRQKQPVKFKSEVIDEAIRNEGQDINGKDAFRYEPRIKKITNNLGQAVWKGEYIYE